MQYPDARILIFTKAPEPGYAKTRLIPALGAEGAAQLQRRLVTHTVSKACAPDLCPVELWCAPDSRHPVFQALAANHPLVLHTQIEGDLGVRMEHATAEVLSRSRMVVLIGTDCPSLDAAYLRQAFAGLAGGDDVVLGPAEDGGYVLLGLKACEPGLFQGIPWGSSDVLECTRRRLKALGKGWRELAVLWDLDRPADLKRLPPALR